HASAVRLLDAGGELEKRAFAAAVGAEKEGEARPDLEVDPIEDRLARTVGKGRLYEADQIDSPRRSRTADRPRRGGAAPASGGASVFGRAPPRRARPTGWRTAARGRPRGGGPRRRQGGGLPSGS